jgi:uncharacterized membrane protein (GlpM family)
MSDNPYRSPEAPSEVIGVISGSRDDLRNVAKYQKGIIVAILIYMVAVIGQFALPSELRVLSAITGLLAGLVGAVFVFLLAMKTYGTGSGILLGILSLMPCFGLIILLMVNGRATNILKQNGIKVGLLGANVSSI